MIEIPLEMVKGDGGMGSDHGKENESFLDSFPQKMSTETKAHVHTCGTREDGHHNEEHTGDRTG